MTHPSGVPLLEETVHATTRYLQALTVLEDEQARGPSALPGWTRAHVITHLARNADALTNLLRWAATGVPTPMYASDSARDADVEAGASRSADELRADSEASCAALLRAADQVRPEQLETLVTRTPGSQEFPARLVGRLRRTEVEVHHADLLLDYRASDWPPDFSRDLVDRRQRELGLDGPSMVLSSTDVDGLWKLGSGAGPEVRGTVGDLAWWLIGRGGGARLVSSTGELPTIPRWR